MTPDSAVKTAALGNLIDEFGGLIQTGPFGSQLHQRDYTEHGIPVVMPKDIRAGRIDERTVARIPEDKASELSRHYLKPGSIVFPRRGNIGKCAYVDGYAERFICGTGCVKIEPPTEILEPLFVYYYLCLPRVVEWFERNAVGTTMPNLSARIIGRVQLPMLPLQFQRRVASILAAYDRLIENNRRRILLLERAARLLYKEWFVRFRYPGHEHDVFTNRLPVDWRTTRLSDVADITFGQSPSSIYYNNAGVGLPFHQGVSDFGERFTTDRMYCTVQNRMAGPGDILFSVRAPVGRINITIRAIVIGRGIAAIRSLSSHQNFLFYTLKTQFFKEDMMGAGTIFAAITKKDLRNVELVYPTARILNLFAAHVGPMDQQIETLHRSNELLQQARDTLLPRLMSGRIAV